MLLLPTTRSAWALPIYVLAASSVGAQIATITLPYEVGLILSPSQLWTSLHALSRTTGPVKQLAVDLWLLQVVGTDGKGKFLSRTGDIRGKVATERDPLSWSGTFGRRVGLD